MQTYAFIDKVDQSRSAVAMVTIELLQTMGKK